jgi:hypothetical protein
MDKNYQINKQHFCKDVKKTTSNEQEYLTQSDKKNSQVSRTHSHCIIPQKI